MSLVLLDRELPRPEQVVSRRELKAVDRRAASNVHALDRLLTGMAGLAEKPWLMVDRWLDERLWWRPADAPRGRP